MCVCVFVCVRVFRLAAVREAQDLNPFAQSNRRTHEQEQAQSSLIVHPPVPHVSATPDHVGVNRDVDGDDRIQGGEEVPTFFQSEL